MMSAEANAPGDRLVRRGADQPAGVRRRRDNLPRATATQTHATDEAYYAKVWYWSTPQADCADDGRATTCKTQDDWVKAWTDDPRQLSRGHR